MILSGILLCSILRATVQSSGPRLAADCLDAEMECLSDPQCAGSLRMLESCASDETLSPLSEDMQHECLAAQGTLQAYRPLIHCKCQRGMRREESCLRVYWTVRSSQAYDEFDTSPYEDLEMELVRSIEMSRMASIVAASSLPADGQNLCLKAAQDCGLYEKCGSLRSEYVLACTKIMPVTGHCNRQKCHRALRRFLERVPEEYSFGVLFCPCTSRLCGERRRKTIVPSCSYEEKSGKSNCLNLQNTCVREELCRSRLVDFQHHCQPSSLYPSGCLRESGAACLKAYAGLIGTIMTPNYVSNSSAEVSQWCNCEGSGNLRQECLRILHMFTNNSCLWNAITGVSTTPPRPVENTPPSPPRPPPRIQQEVISVNAFPDLNTVEKGEEKEVLDKEEGGEFNVIPLYSEKATESNVRSGGRPIAMATTPSLLLLLSAALS